MNPCYMTADEWLKLQLPSPRWLRIKDLHLEQIHDSVGEAADALEGYILMNKYWDLHGMLTSLHISFHRHFHILRVSKTHHDISCACALPMHVQLNQIEVAALSAGSQVDTSLVPLAAVLTVCDGCERADLLHCTLVGWSPGC